MVMYDRPALKVRAKESLSNNWGTAILVYVVYAIIIGASSSIGVGPLVIGGPLAVGMAVFFMNLVRSQENKLENLFEGFSLCFVNSLVAGLISSILIGLGSIVIVPGILLSLGWSQYSYILRENPELDGWESLKRSYELMRGHKGEYFVLLLSFFGWACVVAITFGLALLYVGPYMQATLAAYYDYLKAAKAEEGTSY
jgi:uncharacterized membrane protein